MLKPSDRLFAMDRASSSQNLPPAPSAPRPPPGFPYRSSLWEAEITSHPPSPSRLPPLPPSTSSAGSGLKRGVLNALAHGRNVAASASTTSFSRQREQLHQRSSSSMSEHSSYPQHPPSLETGVGRRSREFLRRLAQDDAVGGKGKSRAISTMDVGSLPPSATSSVFPPSTFIFARTPTPIESTDEDDDDAGSRLSVFSTASSGGAGGTTSGSSDVDLDLTVEMPVPEPRRPAPLQLDPAPLSFARPSSHSLASPTLGQDASTPSVPSFPSSLHGSDQDVPPRPSHPLPPGSSSTANSRPQVQTRARSPTPSSPSENPYEDAQTPVHGGSLVAERVDEDAPGVHGLGLGLPLGLGLGLEVWPAVPDIEEAPFVSGVIPLSPATPALGGLAIDVAEDHPLTAVAPPAFPSTDDARPSPSSNQRRFLLPPFFGFPRRNRTVSTESSSPELGGGQGWSANETSPVAGAPVARPSTEHTRASTPELVNSSGSAADASFPSTTGVGEPSVNMAGIGTKTLRERRRQSLQSVPVSLPRQSISEDVPLTILAPTYRTVSAPSVPDSSLASPRFPISDTLSPAMSTVAASSVVFSPTASTGWSALSPRSEGSTVATEEMAMLASPTSNDFDHGPRKETSALRTEEDVAHVEREPETHTVSPTKARIQGGWGWQWRAVGDFLGLSSTDLASIATPPLPSSPTSTAGISPRTPQKATFAEHQATPGSASSAKVQFRDSFVQPFGAAAIEVQRATYAPSPRTLDPAAFPSKLDPVPEQSVQDFRPFASAGLKGKAKAISPTPSADSVAPKTPKTPLASTIALKNRSRTPVPTLAVSTPEQVDEERDSARRPASSSLEILRDPKDGRTLSFIEQLEAARSSDALITSRSSPNSLDIDAAFRPSPASTRFSDDHASINTAVVTSALARVRGQQRPRSRPSLSMPAPPEILPRPRRGVSDFGSAFVASVADKTVWPVADYLDSVSPAQATFLLGFLLGPCCWLLGGWWLRSSDGELPSTMLPPYSRRGAAEVGAGWVKANRLAAGVSGFAVTAAFVVALLVVVR